MSRATAATLLIAALALPGQHAPASLQAQSSEHEYLERGVYMMGTLARLSTYATDRNAGLTRLEVALAILEDAERELSTWRPDSAISDLNRRPIGTAWRASERLCRMFARVFEWRDATDGAFDPAIGALIELWGIHDDGRVPTASELLSIRDRVGLQQIEFDPGQCTLMRRAPVTIDVGGFGKGEALDRVAEALPNGPWLIALGGQVTVGGVRPGGEPWLVDIAHPVERQRPYLSVRLRSGSLSTSGGSQRDQVVAGTRVGHILDPRTGQPAAFDGSVTVWHEHGLIADMLSTALAVMGPEEGFRWATERDLSACYLMVENGAVRVLATPAFEETLEPLNAPE